jgi:hypothetical protein
VESASFSIQAKSDTLWNKIKKVRQSSLLISNSHQRCSLDLDLKTTGTAMEDQHVSFQTEVIEEKTPLLRASLSTASLQDFSESNELRKSRWSTDYGTPKTTYWSGTDYGTPMTTHHHFDRKGPAISRSRSRSLGAEVEANLDDSGIFLPALDKGRLNI